jgi:hypothetical protein
MSLEIQVNLSRARASAHVVIDFWRSIFIPKKKLSRVNKLEIINCNFEKRIIVVSEPSGGQVFTSS